MDLGGNLLVAASSNLGDAIRELAADNGFEFDEADTALIDHHNFDARLVSCTFSIYYFISKDDGTHTTLVADKKQLIDAKIVVGDVSSLNPVLFKVIYFICCSVLL